MIFEFEITTPKNTSKNTPLETVLQLKPGLIHKLEARFPAGCAGLLHLAIMREVQQVWPTNPLGDFASDGETISYAEEYLLTDSPYQLQAHTWNEDTAYDHALRLRFGIFAPAAVLYGGALVYQGAQAVQQLIASE